MWPRPLAFEWLGAAWLSLTAVQVGAFCRVHGFVLVDGRQAAHPESLDSEGEFQSCSVACVFQLFTFGDLNSKLGL